MFLDYSTRGIFAYKRAADAGAHIATGYFPPGGADWAMRCAAGRRHWNQILFSTLDTQRFFFCVRPYYKPYRVGLHEYRGANAEDFSGINEIDLLLGLCSANNIAYSAAGRQVLFMMPRTGTLRTACAARA
jgi:hypothetical protein